MSGRCCQHLMQLAAGPGLCPTDVWYRWRAAGATAAWLCNSTRRNCKKQYTSSCPPRINASDYADAPAGFVGRVRISLQSVVNHVRLPAECLSSYLQDNRGQTSYVVATAILWADAMSAAGHHRIACAAMATPLVDWVAKGTTTLETLGRHALHVEHDTKATRHANGAHTLVARLKTLLGRDLRPHDIEAELAERSYASRPHYYDLHDPATRVEWLRGLTRHLSKRVSEGLQAMVGKAQTPEAWWATRIAWLPGGTASDKSRDAWPQTLRDQKYIASSKTMMLGPKTLTWFSDITKRRPRMVCRAATKHEPGNKRRPLRASDDESYVMQAYASNNLEKFFSLDGAVMRQTPEDVRETLVGIANMRSGQILCLDYSDFNLTHTTLTRCLYNCIIAVQYAKNGAHDQAAAALWVAKAQLQHMLDSQLSNQGLSSGERDTARDNTMLHQAYADLAVERVSLRDGYQPCGMRRMCGDDEIAIGLRWEHAVAYYHEHRAQGHDLQARKTLVSPHCGEFLQYNMHTSGALPTMPLTPNLNNFVSGSWYKNSNYDPYEYPDQVSSAASSCVRRGARPRTMRMLCMATCQWLCAGTPWRTNLMATNFFGASTKYTRPKAPVREAIDAIGAGQHAGTRDYAAKIKSRFTFDAQQMAALSEAAMEMAYAGAAMAYANHTKLFTIEHVPETLERISEDTLAHEPPPMTGVFRKWVTASTEQRHDPMTWLGVQLGLPPKLITKFGMAALVRAATNQGRAAINGLGATTHKAVLRPHEYAMLPGAALPYFTTETQL